MIATAYNGTGSVTDDTACWSDNTITISATNTASTLPFRSVQSEDDIKAETKKRNRKRSIWGVLAMQWLHCRPPAKDCSPAGAFRAPRPTMRSSSTGVRNFRRAA